MYKPRPSRAIVWAILGLLLLSGFAGLGVIGMSNSLGTSATQSYSVPQLAVPHANALHPRSVNGNPDLTVNGGYLKLSPSTNGGLNTYLMGGNITVENGGLLAIFNMTVRFESVTGQSCACSSALLQRYTFNIETGGHVSLYNSTITTDPNQIYAYSKLNLTVTGGGTLTLDHNSALEFPGDVWVSGGSLLELTDSSITGNPPVASGWPANYTSDNSFGPAVLVTGSSSLVASGSSINGSYASPLAGTAALQENFASANAATALSSTGTTTIANIVPSTPLVLDGYNAWSAASVNFMYNNSGAPVSSTVSFLLYGSPAQNIPVTFQRTSGVGYLQVNLSLGFVQGTLDSGNLASLLNAFHIGTGVGGGYVSLSAASAPGVTLNSTWISLTPAFQYNFVVSGGSKVVAIDTTFNVNWVAPGTVPAYASHKFLLQGGSVAYLVNSTANSYWTNPYSNVSAFVPDQTSNFYVMQWVQTTVVNPQGAPVVGASLGAFPANPASTNPNNVTGLNFASSTWLQASVPMLFNALNAWATNVEGSTGYDITNGQGVARIALVTNNVTSLSVPSGYSFGEYNMTLFETATNITGNGGTTVSERISSPSLCAWPYPSGCGRPTNIPVVQLPLLTADLRIVGLQFDLADAAGSNPPTFTENYNVTVNVTVQDANFFSIQAPSVPLDVFDDYSTGGGTGTVAYNDTVGFTPLLNGAFANPTATATLQFTFQLPYSSIGPHMLYAMIDPTHSTVWPTSIGKAAGAQFNSNGVPFETPTGAGQVSTSILDACTGKPVVSGSTNSCNQLTLVATLSNKGDTTAQPGSTGVQFLLGMSNTPTPPAPGAFTAVGAPQLITSAVVPQTGSAKVQVTLTSPCSCWVTIQAVVSYAATTSGNNGPRPFSFEVPTSSLVPVTTVDYTSLVFTYLTEQQRNASGTFYATPNASVGIGTDLGFRAAVVNTGGPGASTTFQLATLVTAQRTYWLNLTNPDTTYSTFTQWEKQNLTAHWVLNESVMTASGPVAGGATRLFAIFVTYQDGGQSYTRVAQFNVTVWPSNIQIHGIQFNDKTVAWGTNPTWTVPGEVVFNGSGYASLDVYYVGQNGIGNRSYGDYLGLGYVARAQNGVAFTNFTFGLPNSANSPMTPGVYQVVFVATYNGLTRWDPTTYTVTLQPAAASCSGSQELSQFFCNGAPTTLFYLIIAAVAAVVVVVVAVLLMSKTGRGRLVECGECGELIPETAPACPRCGAEFETEMVRCSRCASTIPAKSQLCPECSALLLGKSGASPEEAQRKEYAQAIERYRAEARKELGDNYTEGAFWDWWKRQPTYLSYNAFKLQQTQGTRSGMAAPSAQKVSADDLLYQGGAPPPGGAGPGGLGAGFSAPPTARGPVPPPSAPGPAPVPGATGANMKVCSSCQREINADFLVCPFCGAATK